MPSPWIVNLGSYYFYCNAQPTNQSMDLECIVTEATSGLPGSGPEQHLSFFYDATNSATLQGNVVGSDASYQILVSTNSSVFMQQVLWALALPNNITKMIWIEGSPSATTGGYPYTVDAFFLCPLQLEPALVAAEIALPEITADMPEDLRKALERRRERQVRLHEARLRVTPRR